MTSRLSFDLDIPDIQRHLSENSDIDEQDQYGRTALHRAIFLKRWDTAHLLLDRGAAVNLYTVKGNTALHLAIGNGSDIEIVRHLLRRGANINDQDYVGQTVLHVAVKNNTCNGPNDYTEIVAMLLESGANVNCVDHDGRTPLHIAFMFTSLSVTESLLPSEADVSLIDDYSRTPVHVAGLKGAVIVKMLVQAGADVQAVDAEGCTPLELTCHAKLVEYLLLNGAVLCDSTLLCYVYNMDVMKVLIKFLAVNLLKKMFSHDNDFRMKCDRTPELNTFKHDCIVEVEKMKKHKIGTLSLFNVFSGSPDPVFASRADEIEKELDIAKKQNEYPIYLSLMKSKFREGVKRKALLDEATDTLPILIPELRKMILSQLTDRDLINVIKAFESTNNSC